MAGFKKPAHVEIAGKKMRPDIIARKGHITRIIEIKSSEASQKVNLLRRYAKENKNVKLSVESVKVAK